MPKTPCDIDEIAKDLGDVMTCMQWWRHICVAWRVLIISELVNDAQKTLLCLCKVSWQLVHALKSYGQNMFSHRPLTIHKAISSHSAAVRRPSQKKRGVERVHWPRWSGMDWVTQNDDTSPCRVCRAMTYCALPCRAVWLLLDATLYWLISGTR